MFPTMPIKTTTNRWKFTSVKKLNINLNSPKTNSPIIGKKCEYLFIWNWLTLILFNFANSNVKPLPTKYIKK